ncbi:MAG: phosphatidylcholine/phosphatidylserine synthase [Alphaproteobacteria bacterium]|nr:phosphatidylcholine/phosphatidylserine synthase [Alphaproteobacteria bacterium]
MIRKIDAKEMIKVSGKKFQTLSFTRLLPNIATVMALAVGMSAIRFALMGKYEFAVIATLIAAFLDAMDGRLARLLGASSDFGAELDSLSDFISFGVSPAIVIYILSLNAWKGIGWTIALFFAVCMGLRLARFNIYNRSDNPEMQGWSKRFFMGVPAPAAASLGLLPLVLYFACDLTVFISPYVCGFFMILSGFLMVSRLPTFSFKTIQIPSRWVGLSLLAVGILVALLLSDFWLTLSAILFVYLFSIPFSVRAFKKLKSQTSDVQDSFAEENAEAP